VIGVLPDLDVSRKECGLDLGGRTAAKATQTGRWCRPSSTGCRHRDRRDRCLGIRPPLAGEIRWPPNWSSKARHRLPSSPAVPAKHRWRQERRPVRRDRWAIDVDE